MTDVRSRPVSRPRRSWLAAGALLVAVVASACSGEGGGHNEPGTGPSTAGTAGSQGASQGPGGGTSASPASCLSSHGVPPQRLNELFGAVAGSSRQSVSRATLRSAGIACWATMSGTPAGGVLKGIENCVTAHHVATAHTGSPLADLLLLDPASATDRSVLKACQPAGHTGGH